jgi:uncharacterized protein YcgI (DUF1989 family)
MTRTPKHELKLLESVTIPARRGRAARLAKGQRLRVVNVHGTQVVDCWAFNADNLGEFMSMEHTRVSLGRYRPRVGDRLVTNRRRPILRLLEDSSPGVHDTMMAACDRYRYETLGHPGYHDNCTDNMWEAMVGLRLKPTETPCPLNLWQNTPVGADGSIEQLPTVSRRGDHVLFAAEMDLVICLSCCPQDMVPINGMKPRGARFEILG